MIDLDGTLIDSDKIHYNAYKPVFEKRGVNLDYNDYYNILENEGIDKFIETKFSEEEKGLIKKEKNYILKQTQNVDFIKNADKFIEYIANNSINHVIVTNTSLENVNFFKDKLPLLKKLKNWVVREDYKIPKPNSECYYLAKKMYYRGENTIIGIENSINGFYALKSVTECIYIVTDANHPSYNKLKKEDSYLINDFLSVFC